MRLLSYVEDMSGDEKVRTIQSKELWLAEDMTFYVVSCMSTITMDKEEAICLNEHRSVVTTVECEDDIFFDMGSLICELDDICLFELFSRCGPWRKRRCKQNLYRCCCVRHDRERRFQKEQADTMNVLLVKPFMYPQAAGSGSWRICRKP